MILDEIRALVASKRGESAILGLARLQSFAPKVRITALSATVARPDLLRDWIAAPLPDAPAELLLGRGGAPRAPSSPAATTCPGPGIRRPTRYPSSTNRNRERDEADTCAQGAVAHNVLHVNGDQHRDGE